MKILGCGIAGCVLVLGLAAAPAQAMGPVDGEFGAVWWASDFDVTMSDASVSDDAGAPGFRAEVWMFKRWGVRAERYSSKLDEFDGPDSDYTSVDFRWRAFSPSENNYFAIGVGWQQMDLATIGLDGSTSGARIGAEGRVALGGLFYLYGQGSYLPSLDDAPAVDPLLGHFENLDGYEFETGVSWKIAPFMSLRAGYRTQTINFTMTGFEPIPDGPTEIDGETESSGFLAGLTFRF
jgi:opacity protein-like surface antigen